MSAFYTKNDASQFLSMMKRLTDAAFEEVPAEHIAALGKFCYDRANEAIRGKGTKAKKQSKKPQINTHGGRSGNIGDTNEDDFM